jgi:hypothetical protein
MLSGNKKMKQSNFTTDTHIYGALLILCCAAYLRPDKTMYTEVADVPPTYIKQTLGSYD